jgi:hypothetical protein
MAMSARRFVLNPLALAACSLLLTSGAFAQTPESGTGDGPAPPPLVPNESDTRSPKERCADSYVKAQELQRASQLKAAAAEFVRCQQPECGEVVTAECTRLYEQVVAQTPSVVFALYGRKREELRTAQVYLNGELVLEKLEGAAISLDPGVHKFRFEAAGYPPKEQEVTVRRGDRDRLIEVPLVKEEAPPPTPAGAAAEAPSRPLRIPLVSYVLAGGAVAAFGTGTALLLSGKASYGDLEDNCGTQGLCRESEVDSVKSRYLLGNVALGVGVAATAAAVTFTILANRADDEVGPKVSASAAPTGTRVTFDWRF